MLFRYGITGRDFSVIKFFLTGRYLNVVINDMSSGALAINIGVPKRVDSDLLFFLLYINDLIKSKLRSFVNTYADDIMVHFLNSR